MLQNVQYSMCMILWMLDPREVSLSQSYRLSVSRDDKALQEALYFCCCILMCNARIAQTLSAAWCVDAVRGIAQPTLQRLLLLRRERIIQTLQAARDEDGEVAPSPAVSLLERARTIRALPLGADTVKGSLDSLAEGKKASSLPQLDDPAKVAPAPAWQWSKHAAGQLYIPCECFECLRCIWTAKACMHWDVMAAPARAASRGRCC